MTANAYRGEAELDLGGEPHTLCFDWNAIGALRSEYGAQWPARIARAIDETEMEVVATALEIGLRRHHQGAWTAARIMDLSPPVNLATAALNTAILRAFTGIDPPREAPENPLMARLRTLFRRASALPASLD